jgi:hypothetical protein
MTEDHARTIWSTEPSELHQFTHDDLVQCDAWIKGYTLKRLKQRRVFYSLPIYMRDYLLTCVSAHYGSVETDRFLMAMKAYPEWMLEKAGAS